MLEEGRGAAVKSGCRLELVKVLAFLAKVGTAQGNLAQAKQASV